jgi:hypothetical protein
MAAQQLLQGINTMQMQAGLMPGGVAPPAAPPMMAPQHPSDFSSNLRVNFALTNQQFFNPSPMPMGGGMTPAPYTPGFMTPAMPMGSFGYGGMQNRVAAIQSTNNMLAMGQAGTGLGMRGIGGLAAAGFGSMFGGPVGALGGVAAYEAFGGGQAMQNFGAGFMNPLINRRQQQLGIQGMSMGFVNSGADLSSMGMGLSATAAGRLSSGLNEMAGSGAFRSQTGGIFNRQDVMKITSLSAQLGMLDQSQTADQIKNEIGKISRALASFIKIAGEPDIQKAMQMMSTMRSSGMASGEATLALRHARQFARMAGTDIEGVMQAGMAGVGVYQAHGLSGAAGLNAGMASAGMARMLAGTMSPARLAMAGGQEGIASTMVGAGAAAASLGAILPGMVTRGGPGGRLTIDRESLADLTSGRVGIQDFMRRGASRMQSLGRGGVEELVTRQSELQDEMSRGMGGMNATLLPLILARRVQEATPGMSMRGALMTLGMNQQQAGTYAQMARDPRFLQGMRQQAEVSAREITGEARERAESRAMEAHIPQWVRSLEHSMERLGTNIGRSADRISQSVGNTQDVSEQIAAAGGAGNVIRIIGQQGDFQGNEVTRAAARERLTTAAGRNEFARMYSTATGVGQRISAREDAMGLAQAQARAIRPLGLIPGAGLAAFGVDTIAGGFGSEGYRVPFIGGTRSDFLRQTIEGQEGLVTQIAGMTGITALTGQERTSAQVHARAREMGAVGRELERGATRTTRETRREQRRARDILGREGVTSPEDRVRYMAAAANAHNAYLRNLSTMGFQTGNYTREGAIASMERGLVEAGMSPAQASVLARDQSVRQEILDSARDSMSGEERTIADRVVAAGAAATDARTAQAVSAQRQQAQAVAETALSSLGLERGTFGIFGGASDADRTAAAAALAGNVNARGRSGQVATVARLETARQALMAHNTTGSRRRAAELAARIREFDPTIREAATRQVTAAGMTAEGLSRMGASLASARSSADMMNTLNRAAEGLGASETLNAVSGVTRLVGVDAGQAIAGGRTESEQYAAMRRYLEGGNVATGQMTEAQIAAIRGGGARGLEAFRGLVGAGGAQAARTSELFSVSGIGALASRVIQGQTTGLLSELGEGYVMSPEEAAEAAAGTAGETAAPQTFEQAVGTFAQASTTLLEAANGMAGSSATRTLAGGMAGLVIGGPVGAIVGAIGANLMD